MGGSGGVPGSSGGFRGVPGWLVSNSIISMLFPNYNDLFSGEGDCNKSLQNKGNETKINFSPQV